MTELETIIEDFLTWKDGPKCDFIVSFNGIDKTRPKITYRKGETNKVLTAKELFKFWQETIYTHKS